MTTIHITGPAASGKTTLMNTVKDKHPHIVCVDLDEIDDKHALYLIDKKPKELKRDFEGVFFPEKEKLNKMWFDDFIKHHQNKIILLVGVPMGSLNVEHKICLKVDPIEVYRRLVTRTIHEVCNNKEQLLDELNGDLFFLKPLSIHKHHIRGTIVEPLNVEKQQRFYMKVRQQKYKLMTPEATLKYIDQIAIKK